MAALSSCSAVVPSSLLAVKSAAAPKRTVSQKLFVRNVSRVVMSAKKEQDFVGPTAIALLAAAVLPEIAEAAQPGVSPSLNNLIGSIIAGGVVLGGIGVAVAGVAVFDPVKRK